MSANSGTGGDDDLYVARTVPSGEVRHAFHATRHGSRPTPRPAGAGGAARRSGPGLLLLRSPGGRSRFAYERRVVGAALRRRSTVDGRRGRAPPRPSRRRDLGTPAGRGRAAHPPGAASRGERALGPRRTTTPPGRRRAPLRRPHPADRLAALRG